MAPAAYEAPKPVPAPEMEVNRKTEELMVPETKAMFELVPSRISKASPTSRFDVLVTVKRSSIAEPV
jgi:hypothetical protein